jgi:hypothetical protein
MMDLLDLRRGVLEECARAAHEVNRAYCLAIGDSSQPSWNDAPEWQRSSARQGVLGVYYGNGPVESHGSWMAEKLANGWKYGPVKDPDKKEHPCMVAYEDLPPEQRKKDHLFITTVAAMFVALGVQRGGEE